MIKKILIIMFFAYALVTGAQVLKDEKFAYEIYLPNNWVRTVVSDSLHQFADTTATYKSVIGIKRYGFSSNDYPSANEWTIANFIAYKLSVTYSIDPFGVVLYYDSTSACSQGTLRAAEAYSQFYSADTAIGAWAEFIRFCALGNKGYEIYALGDTTDMKTNLGTYGAILGSVIIPDVATENSSQLLPVRRTRDTRVRMVDPLGRTLPINVKAHGAAVLRQSIIIKMH